MHIFSCSSKFYLLFKKIYQHTRQIAKKKLEQNIKIDLQFLIKNVKCRFMAGSSLIENEEEESDEESEKKDKKKLKGVKRILKEHVVS